MSRPRCIRLSRLPPFAMTPPRPIAPPSPKRASVRTSPETTPPGAGDDASFLAYLAEKSRLALPETVPCKACTNLRRFFPVPCKPCTRPSPISVISYRSGSEAFRFYAAPKLSVRHRDGFQYQHRLSPELPETGQHRFSEWPPALSRVRNRFSVRRWGSLSPFALSASKSSRASSRCA